IRLLSVNRLSRIVLREALGVTETPATLRSASTPDSTLCLPLISNPAHGQPEARRPLMCQWSPSTTTQEAVRPLILGSAPLPYALTVIGEAAVPRALSVSGPRKEPPRLTATVSPGRSSAALTGSSVRQARSGAVPSAASSPSLEST